MKYVFSALLLVFLLPAIGCRQHGHKKAVPPIDSTEIKRRMREKEARDAISHPDAFHAFLEGLINRERLQLITNWNKDPDDSERWIIPMDYNEPPDTCFDFPFKDIRMTYCIVHFGIENDPEKSCEDGSQFTINGYKLPIDKECGRCDPLLIPSTIRRYSYGNQQIIVMWGRLKNYNGYGDRIQFNYFFDITKKPYAQDIYTNNDAHVYYPILYGDLNEDTLLDRVIVDGVLYPYCGDSCPVTIEAQTYKNNKWKQLKDNHGHPYYINVHTDGYMDRFKIVSYNWMRLLDKGK